MSYKKYIFIPALKSIGYIALYGLSVVMFFFFNGVIPLPIVVIGFPYLDIYRSWLGF